jgi:hypothetical protein
VVRDGAGLIAVGSVDTDGVDLAQLLTSARSVAGASLVAAIDPVDPTTRADVIQLSDPSQCSRWPGRLVGCAVHGMAEVDQAWNAGCDYVVVDRRDRDAITCLAGTMGHTPSPVWFVAGCAAVSEVRQALSEGARRLWIDSRVGDQARAWSGEIRRVWAEDPAMNGMRRIEELL